MPENPKKKSLEQIVLEAGDRVLKEKNTYQPGGTLPEEQIKLLLGDEPEKKKSIPQNTSETPKTPLLVDAEESQKPVTTGSLNTLSGDPSKVDFSKEPKVDNGFFSSENTKPLQEPVLSNDAEMQQPDSNPYTNVAITEKDIKKKDAQLAQMDNGVSRPMSAIATFNQHVYGLPATLLETFSVGANQVGRLTEAIGLEDRTPTEEMPTYKLAQWYRDSIKEISPDNPAYQDELFTTASGALGDLTTLVLSGGTSRVPQAINEIQQFTKASNLFTTAVKEGKKLISTPPALVGAMQVGTNEFKQAKAAGASDDEAFGAFIKNAGVGSVLEAIPIMKFFSRLDKTTGGGVKKAIQTGAVQGVEEMTTEVAQQVFSNVDAANSYDTARKWYDGMVESGGIGFGLGFLLGGMGTSLRKKQAEAKTPEEKAAFQKAIDFTEAKGTELRLQEESKENKIQSENAGSKIDTPADTGAQQETVTPEQQMPVSEGDSTPVDQSIIDLATRISQGETTFSPEELQLQANHASEVEKALLNLSIDTSGIKATEETATINDPALPEQVAVDDASPGEDVALETSDQPSVETVKKPEVKTPVSENAGLTSEVSPSEADQLLEAGRVPAFNKKVSELTDALKNKKIDFAKVENSQDVQDEIEDIKLDASSLIDSVKNTKERLEKKKKLTKVQTEELASANELLSQIPEDYEDYSNDTLELISKHGEALSSYDGYKKIAERLSDVYDTIQSNEFAMVSGKGTGNLFEQGADEVLKEEVPPIPPEDAKPSPDKGGNKKQNTKSVYRNVIERSSLDDDIKSRLKANDKYNVFTNEESSAIADRFIDEYDSIDEAVGAALKSNSGVHGAVKTMVIGKAITDITEQYNKAKTPEEKELLTDKQAEYIDLIDNLVREAGQTAQAVSAMYKATVLGMKKATEKKIEKYNDFMVEKNGLDAPTEEKIAATFEKAADETLSDTAFQALQKQLEELNEKVAKLEEAAKEKKKAERETKKKNVKDRLEKNKTKFKDIDWLGKGNVAMSSIIPIPLNPEKVKALAALAKDYIELGAIDAAEVYEKLNAYIKEVTKGKGFLDEKDFDPIYKAAEKKSDLDLKKNINKEIKKQKVKLNELVREHFSNRETALKSIKDKIFESYPGLDKAQVELFSKKIDAIFKEKLVKEQVKQISKSHSSVVKNITTNQKEKNENMAKKLVKEINLGNVDSDFYIELWKERHGLINTNNKEIRSTIDDLIAKVHRSAEGQLKNRAETDLLDYIVSMQKKSIVKMLISGAYGNMLSSYQSHLNNMVFGSTAVAKQVAKRAIPTRKNWTAIGVALKGFKHALVEVRDILRTGYRDQGSEYVKESDALIKGNKFMQAISLAFRGLAAEDAFFNRPLTDMMEFEGLYEKAIATEIEKRKDPYYNRKENKEIVAEINKQFIWNFNEHNSIKKEAAKDVETSEGLEKPLFVEKNVDYKDNNGNTQTKTILERNPEYSNVKYNKYYRLQKMRTFEIAEAKRDTSGNIKKEAKEWANDQLLIGTPRGDAGIVARMINDTLGLDAPIAKMVIVPFVNVPLNSFNLLVETSPYGTLTLGAKYAHHLVTGKPMKETSFLTTGAERRGIDPVMTRKRKTQLLQRQAFFYSTAIGIYALSKMTYTDEDGEEKPIVEVTADGKKNWLKNDQLKKGTGDYKEYTFTINWPVKYQFSYKYTPFAGILAPLGKMMDYEKYEVHDPKKEISLGKKLSLVMLSYGSFLIDAASLKGLSDAFNFNAQDFERSKDEEAWLETTMRNMGKSLSKQVQSKGIPFSGLLKAANEDISGIMEADDHQANEWYEYMMRDIPVLDQMLDFKYDHLGRPVKSVADVPVLWNGNYKKDDYYALCQKFDYENKFYSKYTITDPEDSDQQAELTYRDLTILNKSRGEIAHKMLYEDGMLQQITDEAEQEETQYQQNKYFKEEMDKLFKEATEEAKILYFQSKSHQTE